MSQASETVINMVRLDGNLYSSYKDRISIKVEYSPLSKGHNFKPLRHHSLLAVLCNNASFVNLKCDQFSIKGANIGNVWMFTTNSLPLSESFATNWSIEHDGVLKEMVYGCIQQNKKYLKT